MNPPSVAYAYHPSFIEFEAVLDHATQSNATLRRAFVKRFIDFMLGQRMNVNAEGLVHDVLEEVVVGFVAAYEASVATATDDTGHPYYYGSVAEWLKMTKLDHSAADIINVEITKRIVELRNKYADEMSDEMFIEVDHLSPSHLINKWLDHIELLSELGEGRSYVSIRRVLTILARCHELLIAHVVTNTGR